MTARPTEMDRRAALPARPPLNLTVAQAIDDAGIHPGVGMAVLACRCGNAIDLDECQRADPLVEPDPSAIVIRPIVCPACVGFIRSRT